MPTSVKSFDNSTSQGLQSAVNTFITSTHGITLIRDIAFLVVDNPGQIPKHTYTAFIVYEHR